MDEKDWLAQRFDENRAHLRAVAFRMLGSASEADDAVQEAWLKLAHFETRDIANLGGWLRTIVARVCLDMLRSRQARREEPVVPIEDAPGGSGGRRLDSSIALMMPTEFPSGSSTMAYRAPQNASSGALWLRCPAAVARACT